MTVPQNAYALQMTAAIASVNAVIDTIGTMQYDSPIVLNTVYVAVQNARAPFDAAFQAFENDIDQTTVGGVDVGIPAQLMAPELLNQASDLMQEYNVIIAEAYLLRAGQNILIAPG